MHDSWQIERGALRGWAPPSHAITFKHIYVEDFYILYTIMKFNLYTMIGQKILYTPINHKPSNY